MNSIKFQIEPTNSETIVKFNANTMLTQGSFEFNNIDEAKNAPLAQKLFHFPFVKKVYYAANFIALERFSIVDWADVQDEIKNTLEDFMNNGGVLMNEEPTKKQIPVSVYAEVTPNPNVLKFVSNKKLVTQDFEFKNIEEAKNAPLATELFNFSFVKEVFISENYVSITKYDVVEWNEVTNEIRSFIREFIADGKTIAIADEIKMDEATSESTSEVALDEVSEQIVSILDEYIRPAVAADGGNIAFESYDPESKRVHVILQGACSGCPSSTFTLKNGIENMLKQMIPGKVEEVVAL